MLRRNPQKKPRNIVVVSVRWAERADKVPKAEEKASRRQE